MAIELKSLQDVMALDFDDVIDVRAARRVCRRPSARRDQPSVLDDEERARVGTIYKQISPFDARKIGAALVAQNAARHLQGPLADRPGGWRPLVYCWRGGKGPGPLPPSLARSVGGSRW